MSDAPPPDPVPPGGRVARALAGGGTLEVLSGRGGVSTGLLVERGGTSLLIDCGDGVARDLADRGAAAGSLAAVILTHDHGDHTAGLYALLWWLKLGGRAEPLPVLAPAHAPTVDGLLELWTRGPGARAAFAVRREVLVHEAPSAAGCFRLTTFPVRHRASSSDPAGALMEVHGLRLEVGSLRIVVSSDTGPCERLEREADGADLAVIEATFPGHEPAPPDTHLSEAQAVAIGRRARSYLLYHRR